MLSDENFANGLHGLNVNSAAEKLEEKIFSCFVKAFPLCTVMMSSRDPSWVTPKVKWLLTKKKNAKRRGEHKKAKRFDEQIKNMKLRFFTKCEQKQWWNKMDSINHRKHDKKSINYDKFEPRELNQHLAQRCGMADDNDSCKVPPSFDMYGESTPEISLNEVCDI